MSVKLILNLLILQILKFNFIKKYNYARQKLIFLHCSRLLRTYSSLYPRAKRRKDSVKAHCPYPRLSRIYKVYQIWERLRKDLWQNHWFNRSRWSPHWLRCLTWWKIHISQQRCLLRLDKDPGQKNRRSCGRKTRELDLPCPNPKESDARLLWAEDHWRGAARAGANFRVKAGVPREMCAG